MLRPIILSTLLFFTALISSYFGIFRGHQTSTAKAEFTLNTFTLSADRAPSGYLEQPDNESRTGQHRIEPKPESAILPGKGFRACIDHFRITSESGRSAEYGSATPLFLRHRNLRI